MGYTIVIADDHDIIREGIKTILHDHPEYKVIAEARDGEEVTEKVKEHKPDILLLDITMPKVSGLDVIEQVLYISPQTKILMITVHKTHVYIMKALESGVKGYINKENAGKELIPALNKISAGETYLTPAVSSYVLERALKKPAKKEEEKKTLLTSREQQILRLVAEGKTAKEIARTLFISRRTVENYKNNLLKKLNLHRTSDLIKYAIQHKVVDLEGM